MRNALVVVLMVIMSSSLIGLAMAQDMATKDECVAKVKEAAALITEKGMEEGLKVLNDKNGPFVWKDSYVFAMNLDDNSIIAHPVQPNLVGKNLIGIKDVNGKMFATEFMSLAKDKGEGWVDYMWPKPGEKEPSPKKTYVYRVPGQPVVVLAGTHEQ